MLKYGSWVTSGTAGGRCASTALALDKHTITEHKAAIKRGKAGFSTSLMDSPRNDEDTVAYWSDLLLKRFVRLSRAVNPDSLASETEFGQG
jgi:hypothetical protein